MTTSNVQNDFLLELLALQQDGKYAISAPTNWVHEPLLHVKTEVDDTVDELEKSILLRSKGNDTARWHFFIGSPGNGKSAAMGNLCRLLFKKGCEVRDEMDDVALEDIAKDKVPYLISVYEDNNKFPSAWIVQDASVVPNPFSPSIDPAKELLQTMEKAWKRGISLIVCANRGVLEKAHRDNHTNNEVNSKQWFNILAEIVGAKTTLKGEKLKYKRDFNEKKSVFKKVEISYSHLDNRSLLLKSNTFDLLFKKATREDYWGICSSCPAQDMCPFNANRNWLLNSEARSRILRLLIRAEVMSGQVIVFREALAIISFILAGCRTDYGTTHPCKWIQDKVEKNDVFSLAVRRVYMCLFASYSPHGLETTEVLRSRQVNSLDSMLDIVDKNPRVAIEHVTLPGSLPPSTDVGVTRLLGASGILASLDPCREALPTEFYERWDNYEIALSNGGELFTQIERDCVFIWRELEEGLELAFGHFTSEAHWALHRWSSNFLLHFGALYEGLSAWDKELDEFADLLELVATPPKERSLEQRKQIKRLDDGIEKLLNTVTEQRGESVIRLSEAVRLSGRWVDDHLKPSTVSNEESGSVSLAVEFSGAERATFVAPMYLWLTRHVKGKLDTRCIPQELLLGARDAQVRAASKGKYAFEDSRVKLEVDAGNEEVFRLERFEGDVFVEYEK